MNSENIYSQDRVNSEVSRNIPSAGEVESPNTDNRNFNSLSDLETNHKHALENGNESEAELIEKEINRSVPDNMKFASEPTDSLIRLIKDKPSVPEGDWSALSHLIHDYYVTKNPNDGKQIDMKRGEDGILYVAVSFPETPDSNFSFNTGVYFYKSTNDGSTWNFLSGYYFYHYVESISLIVESRNNSNPDSTRLILFYTANINNNYSSSYLGYATMLSSGLNSYGGVISYPSAGNRFTNICPVSDGAYYQNATYFGVVCTESDNVTGITENVRFFRTANWGLLWIGSAIVTGFNERNPSADYKEGASDSVYIAVERILNASESQIRIIATPWTPSSNKNIYYTTSAGGVKYEKPCMTIRQTSPAQQILITCTKNKNAVYHSTNNLFSWSTDNSLSLSSAPNESVTFCSSAMTGTKPFTAGWVSVTGDSLFMSKGDLGFFLSNYTVKINNLKVSKFVTPVCVTIPHTPEPNSGLIYSTSTFLGDSVFRVYYNREGSKYLNIKLIPQGLYDPASNKLNIRDTVRVYLRSFYSLNTIIDSAKAVIDSNTLNCSFGFNWLSDGVYYLVIKHRNSLETWSPYQVIGGSSFLYNFTDDYNKAFGGNQIQIDSSPEHYAVYSGDVNQDGFIDLTDVIIISNDAGNFANGYKVTDLNGNNFTDLTDVMMAYNNSANFVSLIRP